MDKTINVLQIGMTRNIGGVESYLMQQYNHIDRKKIRYDFVNITGEYKIVFNDKILSNGDNIYNICSRHLNPIKHYYQWLKLLINNRKKYQVIVLNANSLVYIFPLFIGKIFKIPIRIIHSHNTENENKVNFIKRIVINVNKVLLRFSVTDYFACSKKAGEWMFGTNVPFKIVHNAIEIDKFKYNQKERIAIRKILNLEGNFVLGHVGRFSYQKNHDFLIAIFKEIVEIIPNSILLLIGEAVGDDYYYIRAQEKVKKLDLEKNVKFLGLREDVFKIMQGLDCFILPSHFEGLPLVGIEAQTAGLPCYFSNNITQEAKVTNLVEFISLEKSPKYWANRIIECKGVKRIDTSEDIAQAGYDINKEIKKIENLYLRNINGEI